MAYGFSAHPPLARSPHMPKLELRALILAAALFLVPACMDPTGPKEDVLTLEIASARVPCVGVGPMECLQLRESGDADWDLFYGSIEGFTWEPGYRYTLLVARREVPNPPADGSNQSLRLLEVLSKSPE